MRTILYVMKTDIRLKLVKIEVISSTNTKYLLKRRHEAFRKTSSRHHLLMTVSSF